MRTIAANYFSKQLLQSGSFCIVSIQYTVLIVYVGLKQNQGKDHPVWEKRKFAKRGKNANTVQKPSS
jgi:hypothetical protein